VDWLCLDWLCVEFVNTTDLGIYLDMIFVYFYGEIMKWVMDFGGN
jgi:hypothetical protein